MIKMGSFNYFISWPVNQTEDKTRLADIQDHIVKLHPELEQNKIKTKHFHATISMIQYTNDNPRAISDILMKLWPEINRAFTLYKNKMYGRGQRLFSLSKVSNFGSHIVAEIGNGSGLLGFIRHELNEALEKEGIQTETHFSRFHISLFKDKGDLPNFSNIEYSHDISDIPILLDIPTIELLRVGTLNPGQERKILTLE